MTGHLPEERLHTEEMARLINSMNVAVLEKNVRPASKALDALWTASERTTSFRGFVVSRHDFLVPCSINAIRLVYVLPFLKRAPMSQ